jgi:hypothetical protein
LADDSLWGVVAQCIAGDAEPYASLNKSGLVVKVYNLKQACVRRVLRPSPDPTDPQMKRKELPKVMMKTSNRTRALPPKKTYFTRGI